MRKKYMIIYFISIIGYSQNFNPNSIAKESIQQLQEQQQILKKNGNQNEIINAYTTYIGIEKSKLNVNTIVRNLNTDVKEFELFKIRKKQSKTLKEENGIYTTKIKLEQVTFLNKNNFKLFYDTFSFENQFDYSIENYFEKKKIQL